MTSTRVAIVAATVAACSVAPLSAQNVGPVGFAIRRFDQLFKAVDVPAKDEFETIAAYRERVRAKLDTSAIAIPIDSTAASAAYSADRGQFTITADAGALTINEAWSVKHPNIRVHEDAKVTGKSEASNAYGAKISVSEIATLHWVVASTATTLAKPPDALAYELRSPPDSARVLKPFLRFYIIGHLALGPLVEIATYEHARTQPTLSKPYDITAMRLIIWMDAPEFVIVDRRDGKILLRDTITP